MASNQKGSSKDSSSILTLMVDNSLSDATTPSVTELHSVPAPLAVDHPTPTQDPLIDS